MLHNVALIKQFQQLVTSCSSMVETLCMLALASMGCVYVLGHKADQDLSQFNSYLYITRCVDFADIIKDDGKADVESQILLLNEGARKRPRLFLWEYFDLQNNLMKCTIRNQHLALCSNMQLMQDTFLPSILII